MKIKKRLWDHILGVSHSITKFRHNYKPTQTTKEEDCIMILDRLGRENKQMQRQLDRYHAIQNSRKHLNGEAQERAINSINEITNLDSDKELSDFSDSSKDDFQRYLPTNLRRCC